MSGAPQISAQALLPERMENARSLLVVLMLMAFLAGLALLFSRGASHLSSKWQAQLTDTATVQIIHSTADMRETELTAAIDILQPLLPEARLEKVSQEDASALLRPLHRRAQPVTKQCRICSLFCQY